MEAQLETMSEALVHLYEKWRSREELTMLPHCVEAPLLVDVPDEYLKSSLRLAYIGQETRGWDHDGVKTVQDFLARSDAVPQLLQGYKEFNFAENYRGKCSPFWQFFRKLSSGLGVQPIWTDLVRFDVTYGDSGSRSMFRSDLSLRAEILEAQRGLIADELRELAPHVCLFVVGPGYDSILDSEFVGIERGEVKGFTQRELSKLSHPGLPERSFRTYHPNYLRRSRMEQPILEGLLKEIQLGT